MLAGAENKRKCLGRIVVTLLNKTDDLNTLTNIIVNIDIINLLVTLRSEDF